jgi:hypothetical protein
MLIDPPITIASPSRQRTISLWRPVIALTILAGAYYALLVYVASGELFAPVPHGLAFNSMLLHLLNGSFDVDPVAIGDEGYLRGGLVYSYFGIFPALLRLPLLGVSDFSKTDFTRLSCLAAVTAMAFFKLASVFVVWRARGSSQRLVLLALLVVAVVLSGPQIQFLRGLIYQEVVLWAGALAACFVYIVLRGYYTQNGFTAGILICLALVAGLCLLTRVSTALGLYTALGLLGIRLGWQAVRSKQAHPGSAKVTPIAVFLILSAFVAIAAFINFERWGNPLTFVDLHLSIWAQTHAPERLSRVDEYGEFNLSRGWYGFLYYFFPIWAFSNGDGTLLWSDFQHRMIDAAELPPSSFLISDPLIVLLAIFALVQLVRQRDSLDRTTLAPILIGLTIPGVLMLFAISMTFRYRMEFYPFFELLAFLGFGALLSRPSGPPVAVVTALTVTGVVAAHCLWVLYMLTPFGNAQTMLHGLDVASFYRSFFQ